MYSSGESLVHTTIFNRRVTNAVYYETVWQLSCQRPELSAVTSAGFLKINWQFKVSNIIFDPLGEINSAFKVIPC